jgi:glycogen(starch) synthase
MQRSGTSTRACSAGRDVRILHLSWEYPPVVYGGLGRHVHALAEAQAAAGHDVVVITQHSGAAHEPLDEFVHGVRVVRSPYEPMRLGPDEFLAWASGFNHALVRTALRVGHDWRPDAVHGHDWLVAHAGAAVREAFSVPLVATVHATEAGRHQGWLPGELSRSIHGIEWWFTFEARRVIACSEHMRWEVTRLFDLPVDKVDVIPNGIDLDAWRATRGETADARRRYAGDGPLVVVPGRLEWEKGVHTAIDAMPRLRRRFPGLRLVVAGRGSQRDELEALARRRRVSGAVDFAGWLTAEELRGLASAADVVVVPSIYEPFGLVALEAAAAGAPLVVARTGGLAEGVRDDVTGRTVPAGRPGALADAITDVLHDRVGARRRSRALRAELARDRAWPDIAATTVRTYERAIVEEAALADAARSQDERRRRGGPGLLEGNLLRDDV